MEPRGMQLDQTDLPSPIARKTRGKYVSRACVECRQRKLKCSGNDPCQRCSRRRHRCVFSDDKGVQEVLRRTRQLSASTKTNEIATLDTRVERIEKALQSLTNRLDQRDGSGTTNERDNTPDEPSSFQGDTSFQSPVDQLNESIAHVKQQLGIASETISSPVLARTSRHQDALYDTTVPQASSCTQIRIGAHTLPFPSPLQYERYLTFFFADINPCHPCVNENHFRERSDAMLASNQLERKDNCFLALHFIIFALADILQGISSQQDRRTPGSDWYHAAEDLVGKTKFNGQGDLSLIQYLIFEAIFLTHDDRPNAAYNIAGLACRLCFQFGLHQQTRWNNDGYQVHMKQRILWNAYFVDRRIALSCGRPYAIRDSDLEIDTPVWLDDQQLYTNKTLPPIDVERSYLPYLSCMVTFAKLGGDIWDQMFSVGASKTAPAAETIAILDAKIKHWSETMLSTIPLSPHNKAPSLRQRRQHVLVYTRVDHLRLLIRRRIMVAMEFSASDGRICGDLAINIIGLLMQHREEASEPSSFRFHLATSTGGALLILSTLLCRPLINLGLQEQYTSYTSAFRSGLALLRELSVGLCAARRMLSDLKDIIHVVERMIDQPVQQQAVLDLPTNIDDLMPYGDIDFQQSETWYHFEVGDGDLTQPYYDAAWDGFSTADHARYGVPWI